jgi:predicted transcriptional regulator
MDLSLIQKDLLIALIALYEQKSIPIKGEEIAYIIQRNPGTVRNQMQILRAAGLVDGIPGPKGGYHPTASAFNLLNLSKESGNVAVPISRNGTHLTNIHVLEVSFTTLSCADICHGLIHISGSVRDFMSGDIVVIGPTPVNKLVISGEVFGKDEGKKSLIISINEMVSLPKNPIRCYMTASVKVLSARATLHDVIALFIQEKIHGSPVMDEGVLCGVVTMSDILRGIFNGIDLFASVTCIMSKDVVTIDATARLDESIHLFKVRDVGRLIVMDAGVLAGIITRSDVLRTLQGLQM